MSKPDISPKAAQCLKESIAFGKAIRQFWDTAQPGWIDSFKGRTDFAVDPAERERTLSAISALDFQACMTGSPRMNLYAPSTPPAPAEKATPKR